MAFDVRWMNLYEASREVVFNQTSILQKYPTFLLVYLLVFDLRISRPLAHSRLNICRGRNSRNKMQKRHNFRTQSWVKTPFFHVQVYLFSTCLSFILVFLLTWSFVTRFVYQWLQNKYQINIIKTCKCKFYLLTH